MRIESPWQPKVIQVTLHNNVQWQHEVTHVTSIHNISVFNYLLTYHITMINYLKITVKLTQYIVSKEIF